MPALAEQIRTCSERSDHAGEIQRNNPHAARSDWNHIQTLAVCLSSCFRMTFARDKRLVLQCEQVLLCKFMQYPGLIRELFETDDAEIVNVRTFFIPFVGTIDLSL